ncbi:hypothetical protein PanWU01x14_361370 [Parasponia andersonii]|uniref:Uncharacterized protein n=1 Tax=Parasponia andersonii TaxID=3476 RepID=A0A2P5A7A5_PARAD|nr:hypothetical protein PanWU01x14_361370 [Parasponia andersonii]
MSWLIKCPSVTEDLSVIGQTIGQQLHGMGAFLAPPSPTTSAGLDSSPGSDTESVALAGIWNDLAEIGGSFERWPPYKRTRHESSVTEDLSVIGQTIGQQLRGMGAFLAPPSPTTSAGLDSSPGSDTESVALAGIWNDLAEIGGSFERWPPYKRTRHESS